MPQIGDQHHPDIDLSDAREYAWLLVRSDSLTATGLELWRSIPIRPGSTLSALVGYPLRLLATTLALVLGGGIGLVILLAVFQAPVALFALVHPWLPAVVWQVILLVFGLCVLWYLVVAVSGWLAGAARGDGPAPGTPPTILEGVVPKPADPSAGWNRWHSLHVGHDSSRATLFAACFLLLGIVIQCLAVLAGGAAFSGPVDTAWRWPLLFAEQLFQTMLLGIPIGLMPEWAGIAPASTVGQLLLASVNVFYALGAIALLVQILLPALKPRELFKGTTRDLADYLENADISSGSGLMIHRVGVVRPLDESETVSLSKEEFFAALQARDTG